MQSDIAYIKAAVSNCARCDARYDSLAARIDWVEQQLKDSRSSIFDLEIFQSVVKGILYGLAASIVIMLITAVLEKSESRQTNEAPPDKQVSEHTDLTHSGP